MSNTYPKTLSEVEVKDRFRRLVDSFSTQRECAEHFGCTESYISKLLLQDRWIPERFLDAIGVEREEQTTFIYREKI